MRRNPQEAATVQSRLKPYPAYKDSGVKWLMEIPAHWELGRLKTLLSLSPEKNGAKPVGEMLSVSGYRGVEPKEYDFEERKRTVDELADYRVVRAGQLVVNTMWLNYAGLGVSTIEGHVSPAYRCYSIQQRYERGYLHHLMRSDIYVGRYCALLYGIRPNSLQIKNHDWDSLELLVPPRDEQRAIAAFLDRETARIDALVAKNERLIELLQEKRTTLITRAVIKGLEPNVPMKDSSVEWLGEIPAHWEVKRLWHLTPSDRRIMYGIVLPGPNVAEGVPIVKGGDVSVEHLRLERLNRTTFEIESAYARSRLRAGDLVFAIRGSIGEVASIPDELEGANLTQDAARVSYTSATHGRWLLHTLKSAGVFAQLEAGALGATIRGVNIRDLKRASIPVPPRPEQEEIAAFLDRETAKIDALVAKVRNVIDRLKEFRIALISAAVTGKIDVRDHVNPEGVAT